MDTNARNEDAANAVERMNSVSPSLKSGKYISSTDGDAISPLMLGRNKDVDYFDLDSHSHHRSHHLKRRLRGRGNSSASPGSSHHGLDGTADLPFRSSENDSKLNGRRDHRPHMSAILDEVAAWVHEEKAKKKARKSKRKTKKSLRKKAQQKISDLHPSHDHSPLSRRSSESSDASDLNLEKLESIIHRGMRSSLDLSKSGSLPARASSTNLHRVGSRSQRTQRKGSILKPADTEAQEEEIYVPGCDAILDNSKTFAHSIGAASDEACGEKFPDGSGRDAWQQFKHEIVRLAHTLRLKGWRHVPLERSYEISVERLSGALTNSVYVVAPPDNIVIARESEDPQRQNSSGRRQPTKLLLRIYGAQTEQLIDRKAELSILRRLSKKHIGPRLLGTFTNGRFEEFLNARALKPQDLRDADTSRQIAKRMRELHDGIELLDEERASGPFVWQNWDKCVDRAETIMTFVDRQTASGRRSSKVGLGKTSKPMGHVCGTTWSEFRKAVETYRKHLEREYGGNEKVNDQLTFSHNDTQYGNILRLEPPGESPLMLPANAHKQLVVIDFEYANANVTGLEFANHFTEWCYNYHDPSESYVCNTSHYPTLEEQIRFLRTYIAHQPSYNPAAPSTPRFTPLHRSGSFSSLDLDKLASKAEDIRHAATPYFTEQVLQRQEHKDKAEADAKAHAEVRRLLRETQLWRMANSAQWVVWGILQAQIPGLPQEAKSQVSGAEEPHSDPLDAEDKAAKEDLEDKRPESADGEENAEFDYLAYARDRAMFFWGDCLQMGLVKEEELGKELVAQAKIVPY